MIELKLGTISKAAINRSIKRQFPDIPAKQRTFLTKEMADKLGIFDTKVHPMTNQIWHTLYRGSLTSRAPRERCPLALELFQTD